MKKEFQILFAICLVAYGCMEKNESVQFSGTVPKDVKVINVMDTDGSISLLAQDTVDADGSFRLNVSLKHPQFLDIVSKDYKYRVHVFAHPGDRQIFEISSDKEVSFDGDGKENNNFIVKLRQESGRVRESESIDYKNTDLVVNAFKAQNGKIENFIDAAGLKDQVFVATQKEMLKLNMYGSLIGMTDMLRVTQSMDTILSDSYYGFVRELNFDVPELRNVRYLNSFLKSYFAAMETHGYLTTGLTDYLLVRAQCIADPVIRENYLIYALRQEQYGYNSQLPEIIASIEPMILSEENKKILTEIHEKQNVLAQKYSGLCSGTPAYDLTGTDKNGQSYSLADYRGKAVVIDVWSTNCIPCIGEMPYLHRLEERFKEKDIVFISYSIDFDFQKWSGFVEHRDWKGIQLVDTMGPKSEFVQHYFIRSTPRIILIDREGKIADVFGPKPSDPRLALKIEKLLEK